MPKTKGTGSGWPRQAEPAIEDASLPGLAPDDADGEETQELEAVPLSPGRPLLLVAVFVLVLLAVVVRLIHWTVFPAIPAAAAAPLARPAEPIRGRIVDRNGILMATDTFRGLVYAHPAEFRNDSDTGLTVALSTTLALGWTPELLQPTLAVTGPVAMLTDEATADQCAAINRIEEPNLIWCDFERGRAYPQGQLAAHLLGFLNRERHGLYGVEARYDSWLNRALEWPGNLPPDTKPLADRWKLYLPSPAGRDLVLNLDVPLQYMVERRLQEAIARYRAEAGTIIVMNPRSGAVLAMANYPTFDPGHFSAVPENTWVNSAISAIYEPGSVFKLVTMSAGLDAGYITPDSPFVDEGGLKISGRLIKNAENRTYGAVTIRDALARSINVVSAKVSLRMGPEVFYSYVRQFGFGRLTEVDLQSEVGGIVKQPGRVADWSQYDQAANSFGQAISVTAFQMINAVAAIANEGVLLQPQIVGAMVEDGEVHPIPPRVLGSPIRAETAKTLTQMMVYTVESYSGGNPVPGYRVAGKTGTAEIPTREGYTSEQSIHSFIGFLPAADPQLIIMVKLVKPKVGRWAEQVAVPVFGHVAQDAVQLLEIEPDNRKP